MSYRYTVYTETAPFERLAKLCAAVYTQKLRLDYAPTVHFVKPDPAGEFEHEVRVLGFIQTHCAPPDFCVFVQARNAEQVAGTILHECVHVRQFSRLDALPSREDREAQAHSLAVYLAPSGSFAEVIAALEREYVPVSAMEIKNREHARVARQLNAQIAEQRRQLRRERTQYQLDHFTEIRAAEIKKQTDELLRAFRNYNPTRGLF